MARACSKAESGAAFDSETGVGREMAADAAAAAVALQTQLTTDSCESSAARNTHTSDASSSVRSSAALSRFQVTSVVEPAAAAIDRLLNDYWSHQQELTAQGGGMGSVSGVGDGSLSPTTSSTRLTSHRDSLAFVSTRDAHTQTSGRVLLVYDDDEEADGDDAESDALWDEWCAFVEQRRRQRQPTPTTS